MASEDDGNYSAVLKQKPDVVLDAIGTDWSMALSDEIDAESSKAKKAKMIIDRAKQDGKQDDLIAAFKKLKLEQSAKEYAKVHVGNYTTEGAQKAVPSQSNTPRTWCS